MIRIINCSHHKARGDIIFLSLGILPLNNIVIRRIAIMMYKYSNEILLQVMNELYVKK